ncbi:MAG: Lrp/AsnC family transcriptional regulator [Rhodobacteraceae bacterium]|nr:Lrp/AsnC family transcriptional regulator [Paracoccaceae bacterium]MBR9821239.1 Lrp/AsnC family transcriptional regulator [Paracoccaceae bacterium]
MDDIDRKIITLLAEDARRSLSDIGGAVALSASAVNERIRRLTASGVIRRFTVEVEPKALGRDTLVYLWLALRDGADEEAFRVFAARHPAIEECHHVTGAWSYLAKLRLGGIAEIEPVLDEIKAGGFLGRSETMIALSSPREIGVIPGPA